MSDEPEQPPLETTIVEKSPEQLAQQQKQREQEERLKEEQRKKLEEQARIKKEEEFRKLNEAFKGSLSLLGKTADNTTMGYVKMSLAEKQLERIFPSVLKYKQVLHLDLSTNAIADVSNIMELEHLITLNLSKNQILDIKVFDVEHKLTKLQFLNLSTNKIRSLTQIALPVLRKLNLSENQIADIKDWKGHTTITILQLRKNKLRKLKGLSNMKNLTQLYACENQITDIRGLQNCNSLSKLSLRNNKIKMIMSPFPYLPALVHINLRENQIGSIKQLAKIDEHVNSINVLANPVSDQLGENLKKQIVWTLPHVVKINKSLITEEEKVQFEKERLEKLAQDEKQRLEKEEEARKIAEQEEESKRAAQQQQKPTQ